MTELNSNNIENNITNEIVTIQEKPLEEEKILKNIDVLFENESKKNSDLPVDSTINKDLEEGGTNLVNFIFDALFILEKF